MYPLEPFRSPKFITHEEAVILQDLVVQYKPLKVLELGTVGGFATIYMGLALKKLGIGSVTTIDFADRNSNPSPEENFTKNGLNGWIDIIKLQDNKQLNKYIWKEVQR